MSRPPLSRPAQMSDADAELLDAARALLERVYVTGKHEVATALRDAQGGIHLGIHVDGTARRSTVCAEGVAAGVAITHDPDVEIEAAVSVLRRPGGTWHLIEPCGVCAELLTDYWPRARVWVTRGDEEVAVEAAELLPAKRVRES